MVLDTGSGVFQQVCENEHHLHLKWLGSVVNRDSSRGSVAEITRNALSLASWAQIGSKGRNSAYFWPVSRLIAVKRAAVRQFEVGAIDHGLQCSRTGF